MMITIEYAVVAVVVMAICMVAGIKLYPKLVDYMEIFCKRASELAKGPYADKIKEYLDGKGGEGTYDDLLSVLNQWEEACSDGKVTFQELTRFVWSAYPVAKKFIKASKEIKF